MIGKGKGYAKLSNGFWRTVKIRKLIAQNQWKAIATYALALSYCGDGLTDGHIHEDELLYQLNSDQGTIKALVDSHLLDVDGDGSYAIHNYLEWQRSKDDVRKAAAQSAERVKEWRAKQERSSNADVTALQRSSNADVTALQRSSNANVTEKPRTQNPEPKITKREGREKNTNHENDDPRSQAPSPSMDGGNDDWEARLLGWHHGDEHRRMVDRFAKEGKPKVDLDALEAEFKASIASKGNSQGYVDFDAAFQVWILKRTESLWKKALPDVPTISPSSHGATIVTGPSEGDWNAYWERYLADHPSYGTDVYLRERRRFFSVSSSGTLGGNDVRT